MALVKVPGVVHDFFGRRLVLAPLNMGPLRQLLERTKTMGQEATVDQIDTVIDAVHASLRRNYPDITRDEVENELVDAANAELLMPIIMNRSGLKSVTDDGLPTEALTSGEAQGQGVATLGLTSTPTLSPLQAGPSST